MIVSRITKNEKNKPKLFDPLIKIRNDIEQLLLLPVDLLLKSFISFFFFSLLHLYWSRGAEGFCAVDDDRDLQRLLGLVHCVPSARILWEIFNSFFIRD
jgi:hypothetical protein